MSIAAQDILKDWTNEQYQKAIEDVKSQPAFWYGMDLGSQDKTHFTSFLPMGFKVNDNIKFENKKYKVINIVNSCCIEVKYFKRKSKGWRKHIRRMKCNRAS